MELRPVTSDDLSLYQHLFTNPAVMAELGGANPPEQVPRILQNQLKHVANGKGLVYKVVPDGEAEHGAGLVCVYESSHNDEAISEAGWMVLPAYQGQGLARAAVRALLDRACTEERFRVIHAFTATTNGPSNAICRKLGFELLEETDIDYDAHILHCNHWRIVLG